ncbi:MAG: metallophosphoesterase [Thermodesulfobacteriota bacterium]
MRILFCADIHVSPDHLEAFLAEIRARRPDAAVIGGDIVPHRLGHTGLSFIESHRKYLCETFVPRIREFRREDGTPLYLDLGNDDLLAGRSVLEEHDGALFCLLHGRKHALSPELDILGYMCVPFTPFALKDWERPDTRERPLARPELRVRWDGYVTGKGVREDVRLSPQSGVPISEDLARLSKQVTGPFIFVSHSPPNGTALDMLQSRDHVGSVAVRRFIEHWAQDGRLLASFHGHIHESPEVSGKACEPFGRVWACNPGQRPDRFCFLLWEDGAAEAFPA